jgi:serine phosphatase RsbU (regulator of sigma subunit)
VTEAMNGKSDMFGLDRLKTVLAERAHKTAQDVVAAIVEAVDGFRSDALPPDDLTLFAIKRDQDLV